MTASIDLRPLRRFIREMTLMVERSGDDICESQGPTQLLPQ